MRIAMLAPISWRTPPRGYGPWELVTSLLTEGLVARGVDVTLFATADSQTAGTLAAIAPRGYSEDPSFDAKVWEALHVAHLAGMERAAADDAAYFRRHPGERERVRPPFESEWCACVAMVRVVVIAPGVRIRHAWVTR